MGTSDKRMPVTQGQFLAEQVHITGFTIDALSRQQLTGGLEQGVLRDICHIKVLLLFVHGNWYTCLSKEKGVWSLRF